MGRAPAVRNPPNGQRGFPDCCPLPCVVCACVGTKAGILRFSIGPISHSHLLPFSQQKPYILSPISSLTFEIVVWGVYLHIEWCEYMIFICVYQCLGQFVFLVGIVLHVCTCGIYMYWHMDLCGPSFKWPARNIMVIEHLHINTPYHMITGGMYVGLPSGFYFT